MNAAQVLRLGKLAPLLAGKVSDINDEHIGMALEAFNQESSQETVDAFRAVLGLLDPNQPAADALRKLAPLFERFQSARKEASGEIMHRCPHCENPLVIRLSDLAN